MVLESIINPLDAEKNPSEMVLFGFLYATIGLFLGLWVFKQYAGLVMVFFTVMACFLLVFNVIKLEEEKDLSEKKEIFLLKEHSKAIAVFVLLFIGMTLAYALWYIVLPDSLSSSIFHIPDGYWIVKSW